MTQGSYRCDWQLCKEESIYRLRYTVVPRRRKFEQDACADPYHAEDNPARHFCSADCLASWAAGNASLVAYEKGRVDGYTEERARSGGRAS